MTSTVTLGGNPVKVAGSLPQPGQSAPDFSLVGADLADVSLKNYAGKRKVLNIFPSLDTPTCAGQHRGAVHLGRPTVCPEAFLRC